MKKIVTILFISVLFLSCSGKGNTITAACGVDNPIEDLAWLKDYIEELKNSSQDLSQYFFVAQGTYNRETVFVFNNCCPNCTTIVPIFDCEGNSLGQMDDMIKREEITGTTIIYKPANFACSVQ